MRVLTNPGRTRARSSTPALAGAVRAMELDINYDWATFNFYGTFSAGDPTKLLPGMSRPATRYLSPDDRDFFAVYAR
jgi:hypothetical protein